MNAIKILYTLIFALLFNSVMAQSFLNRNANVPLTFKEMQLQFNTYKRNNDLTHKKGWKHFKRWEMETQMHTNTLGEPVDAGKFVDAIINATKEKEALKNMRSGNALTWSPTGPYVLPDNLTGYMENGIGRINCIAFHPSIPSTYFVGVAQGGVWKTSNNGQSWLPLTDNLPITRVSDIAIDPNNADVMYISLCDFEYIGVSLQLNGRKRNTHYGLGVYKTSDGGVNWQPTGLSFQLTDGDASLIRKTIVNPTNSNQLVAAGTNGIYKSLDAGTTWTKVLDSLFWDLEADPTNANVLYAASGWVNTSNTGNAAIYKSTNFGSTWTMLNTGIPATGSVQRIKLAIAPSNPNIVYAAAVNTQSGLYGLYKTSDAGSTWQFLPPTLNVLEYNEGTGSGGQGEYDLGLDVDPQNANKIAIGGINVWSSSDGGTTFNPASHWTLQYGPTLHGDIHYIRYQPLTGNLFVCSDGGIYRTTNLIPQSWADANNGFLWSTQWSNLNNGLQVSSFYRLSSSRNAAGKIMAGAQDNATFYYDGATWSTVLGGDGMDNYLDPINDSYNIASSQYGNFAQSYDDGQNYMGIDPNVYSELAEWTSPIIADYNIPGTLYAGFENVSKSTDNGDNWQVISTFPSNGIAQTEISALAVANTNSNVLYAAKRVRYEFGVMAKLYNTNNAGTTWIDVTSNLPDSLYYTSVEVNALNASTAYITMAGFEAGKKVYKTTNAGVTWQNISYNLPNIPVNSIKSLPGGNMLLVATDIGVYTLDESTTTWVNAGNDLPNVIISDIEINQAQNKVYVSSFGRGIWEADLSIILNSKSIAISSNLFSIYPNLNNGNFNLKYDTDFKQGQLQIIDIMGRVVYSQQTTSSNTHISLQLASGKYYARLINNDKTSIQSFVVQNE